MAMDWFIPSNLHRQLIEIVCQIHSEPAEILRQTRCHSLAFRDCRKGVKEIAHVSDHGKRRRSSRARQRPPGGKQGLLSPAKTY
jgi:hypothetical protein